MFRWHSTVVEPAGTLSRPPAVAPAGNAAESQRPSHADQVVEHAFDRCNNVGERAPRDADGKLTNPTAFLTAIEGCGIKFGPQGAGTLLAIADARRPTKEEFARICRLPDTKIGGPTKAAASGRGLGFLCSTSGPTTTTAGRGGSRGRGADPMAASRGRGRGAVALGQSGRR